MAAAHLPVERARPILGTLVSIRVDGLPEARANRAIDAGFAEVAHIHALMSFHEAKSEVSRLNRTAATRAVRIHSDTFAVLGRAVEMAAASDGAFDPTIGGRLVSWGFLPAPAGAPKPAPRATWRDIELIVPDKVRFHRPLWIDLGGIAKGYAVDRAIARMALNPKVQCCVNAGGDLRIVGPRAERVLLRVAPTDGMVPVVEIENGSIASSSGRESRKKQGTQIVGPHVDTRHRRAMGTRSFVSVIAPNCLDADALTKVVLALGSRSDAVLRQFGAVAYLNAGRGGWRTLGGES